MIDFNEERHEYTLQGIHIPSMSELMQPIMSDFPLDPYYLERGTAVHDLTEAWDKCRYDPILSDEELLPYIFAYQDFHDQHTVEIIEIEKILFNPTLLYAGTMDRLWVVDGMKHLTDIKSGLKYRQHIVQLVGYALCNTGQFKVSNLYLNPYYTNSMCGERRTWSRAEGCKLLSTIYWDNHRRDRKLVEKILGGSNGQS